MTINVFRYYLGLMDPMYEAIVGLPFQFEASRKITLACSFDRLTAKKWRGIYLAGMGGSALPGEFVRDFLRSYPISFHVLRDYHLPPYVGREDLVICSSYSGNTEETLSVFQESLSQKIPLVAMSHGGELGAWVLKKGIPFIEIPHCVQPRQALGNFFASLITLLERIGQLPSQEKSLKELASFLKQEQDRSEICGRELAQLLKDKIPIVYGPVELTGACLALKIKFNENSKIQSFFNVFPEVNHNEMIGWTYPLMKGAFLYLRASSVSKRITQRMNIMKEMFSDKIPIHSLDLKGGQLLYEMFHAVQIGDFISYYLAKQRNIDPAPVKMVEIFKKKLGAFKKED